MKINMLKILNICIIITTIITDIILFIWGYILCILPVTVLGIVVIISNREEKRCKDLVR